MGFIKSSYSVDTDTHNEMERLRKSINYSKSRYIQNAIRLYNKKIGRMNISEFLDNCSDDEIDILKKEIKKRDK